MRDELTGLQKMRRRRVLSTTQHRKTRLVSESSRGRSCGAGVTSLL